jgi:hypothetical protein
MIRIGLNGGRCGLIPKPRPRSATLPPIRAGALIRDQLVGGGRRALSVVGAELQVVKPRIARLAFGDLARQAIDRRIGEFRRRACLRHAALAFGA